jgi:hypothetical protein
MLFIQSRRIAQREVFQIESWQKGSSPDAERKPFGGTRRDVLSEVEAKSASRVDKIPSFGTKNCSFDTLFGLFVLLLPRFSEQACNRFLLKTHSTEGQSPRSFSPRFVRIRVRSSNWVGLEAIIAF